MYTFVCKDKGRYGVEVITDTVIRVVYTYKDDILEDSYIIEKRDWGNIYHTKREDAAEFVLETDKIKLSVDKESGVCTWYRAGSNDILLQEGRKELAEIDVTGYRVDGGEAVIKRVKTVDGERNFIQNLKKVSEGKAYRGKLHYNWKKDEGIYGLGQGEEGIYNYRGHVQYLYQHNMRIPMPCFVSSENYGILVDCCSLMTFNDDENGSYLYLDTVDQIDYYFSGGEKLDDVIRGFRLLTGKAQMLPKWAFGYIQSKEAYLTQEELVETVAEYRRRGVPIDGIVQDWWTWEEGNWGEKIVDKKRYPNLADAMERIHAMHAHSMVSIWPNMNQGGRNYQEMFEKGHMLMDLATYDAFDEEARSIYFRQADAELFSGGFDSWWCDSTEPFSGPDWGGEVKREPWERFMLVGEEHKKYLGAKRANAFALMHAKGMYENQRKKTEEKRVLNLTRSGYPSIQKYGAVLWSGDTCATWKNFRIQITESLNMALSGYPYWTLDIGAFFTVKEKWQNRGCNCSQDSTMKWFWQGDYEEGVADMAYRELYTRWLQMGAFLPMFRSHGTDTPREIWNFGEKGDAFYDAIEKFIHLRYTFMPYIYSLAANVHFHGDTIQRSLLFDYPQDKTARDIHDEFMFGPSLLVCPITEPMYYEAGNRKIQKAKKWNCYLPEGNNWYDYWTQEKYEGGQYVLVDAPIDRIPLFVREGAILPATPGIQYADEVYSSPMEIYVYRGADGEFTLYEDEGDSYRFEEGSYATTHMVWEDKTNSLKIEPVIGDFPGRNPDRTYHINIIG